MNWTNNLNWIFLSVLVAVRAHQLFLPNIVTKQDPPPDNLVDHSLKYKVDTAKLTIVKEGKGKEVAVDIQFLSDKCHSCSYYTAATISEKTVNKTILVDTKWESHVKLVAHTGTNCTVTYPFHYKEYGSYVVNFTIDDKCSYKGPEVVKKPINSFLPILVAFVILLSLAMLYTIADFWYRKYGSTALPHETQIHEDLGNTEPNSVQEANPTPLVREKSERIKSIDTFRGLCLVVMVFVNFRGGDYWFFHHSPWHGLTVADLVFPWFMFIMGVNITLSINSLITKNVPNSKIAYKLIRRTVLLFGLGMFVVNHSTSWAAFRVPGVLQRFAIAYFLPFVLQWAFHLTPIEIETRAKTNEGELKWWHWCKDVVPYWLQWLIVLAMEALWLFLTFLLPIPGCPTGYLGPGGLDNDGKYINETCVGGAAGYIDRVIFGEAHIYGHPTCKNVYYPTYTSDQRVPYDPEGLLGSINSCIIVILGCQAGKIFLYYKHPLDRAMRWILWCFFLGVISIILCKASANGGWIPVNKNLWTTTFVTTLACMAFFIIPVIYYLVDVKKVWTGRPLDFVGMNSILVYVGHEVFSDYLPFTWGPGSYNSHAEVLAQNIIGVSIWVLIAYYCYRIKFFVKI
uniref:heparan-alpha-glucosaminide N-acetyltransferase-like n=1 Tax=Ciona intestinalis TaxID=7719 RepID=UPI000180CD7B|nr:heparan-alpha-glucosaminide N-acetyltransferase-like [Ciona intestinalis]|eukprot:XP_002120178.1 heparan-alpha-glucosaminide N-acetyltransferase-like [Ciona intestinalis]